MRHMDDTQMTTKKALLVLGALIVLISISLFLPAKWYGITPTKYKERGLILRNDNDLALLSKDTNGNNIPDWKDLLQETIASSSQKTNAVVTINSEDAKRLADPNNLTASFSKNLVVAAAYAKKNGELSEAEKAELLSSLIQKEAKKIVITLYTTDDIIIAKEDTANSKKLYGNTLGALVTQAEKAKLGVEDTKVLQAFLTSKDASILEVFTVKKNTAKSILTSLLAMSVPRSAVPYHLLALNGVSVYITTLENIAEADTDPIRATIAFETYLDSLQGLFSSLQNMKSYFKEEGIIFTSREAGYILTSGYTQ